MNREDVARIEAGGYATWSADEVTEMFGWTLRANGGFTRRVNSATSIGAAEVTPEAGGAIRTWLSERGARFAIRVTPLLDPQTVDAAATIWGLAPVDVTLVLSADLAGPHGEERAVTVVSPMDSGFTEDLIRLNGRPDALRAPWLRIVERSVPRAAGIWVPGRAVGLVTTHRDVAYLYSVAVAEDSRRSGLGTAVTDAARSWAARRGAGLMVLQVLATNEPAVGLYRALGFSEAYRYHYLQPRQRSTDGGDHEQGGQL